MSSRATILAAVRANQPAALPLPPIADFDGDASIARFTTVLTGIGGRAVHWPAGADLPTLLRTLYPTDERTASTLFAAAIPVDATTPTVILETVELAVLQGEFGVAENGAIWVPATRMLHRALPIIAQHLVLVLDTTQLVATMHQAYARLAASGDHSGDYGAFIAGPSKTADIEQSLVIGAHGPRSLTVILR